MKKKQIYGEYTIGINDSGSVEVIKIFKNTTAALREICDENNISYEKKWGPRGIGNKLIKQLLGTEFVAVIGEYIINREKTDSIRVIRKYTNAEDALEEIREELGLPYKDKWEEDDELFANAIIKAIGGGDSSTENATENKSGVVGTVYTASQAKIDVANDPDVVIPEGVTEIEKRAFEYTNLESVTLPEGLLKIGDSAFEECESLYRVRIPESLEIIGDSAFASCGSLSNICFPDSLKIIGKEAFRTTGLEFYELEFPHGLEVIGERAFSYLDCNLTDIEIVLPITLKEVGADAFRSPDWEIDGDDPIKPCFIYEYDYYEDGILYNDDFSKILIVDNPEEVKIHEKITTLGMYFQNCDSIVSINLEGTAIKRIESNCFRNCVNLKEVILNEGLEVIESSFLVDASEVKEIIIPQSVKEISNTAFADSGVEYIKVPERFKDEVKEWKYKVWGEEDRNPTIEFY